MCIVVAVQFGGRVPKPIPVCFMVVIAREFFLSDMLRFAKQSKKKYMIGKINMETLILDGRISGFLGTFDFRIFYFRSHPNMRSKCDTKRPPNELKRETIKKSVLKKPELVRKSS